MQLEHFRTHHLPDRRHIKVARSRSKSPYSTRRDKPFIKACSENPSTPHFQSDYISNTQLNQEYVKSSPLNSALYKNSQKNKPENERFNDLQRKIKQLQSENESLKHHLIE